jgi:hypothetical protein
VEDLSCCDLSVCAYVPFGSRANQSETDVTPEQVGARTRRLQTIEGSKFIGSVGVCSDSALRLGIS